MILRLYLAFALLTGPTWAGILHAALAEKASHFDDVEDLKGQLRFILDGSRGLLETRAAVQGLGGNTLHKLRQLHEKRHRADLDSLAQMTSKSLGVMKRVAESHPTLAILSRRTFLACVALQWILLRQQPLDKEVEQRLAEITSEFYRIHVQSVVRRGFMEYLHISKSGGTSFSAAARSSHCAMAPGIGQLEALGDLARWINGTAFEELTGGTTVMWSFYDTAGRPAEGQSCARRHAHATAAGFNYVSNEFTLHGGGGGGGDEGSGGGGGMRGTHICPQMVNVVTLRNPDVRLASHLHYMLARMKKRLLGHGKPVEFDEADFFAAFCAGDVATWERIAPAVIDNYGVRSFIGERAFHSPVGSISRAHAEVAKALLLQFDLVMDLDAGEGAADLVIQQGLGWNVSMGEVHVRTSSQTFSKLNYSKQECPNEKLLRVLLPRQEPDRQLYRTGRAVAFLDGLFLGVARDLGVRPHGLAASAAAATPAGARRKATAAAAAAVAASTAATNSSCGLLHPAMEATGRRKSRAQRRRRRRRC